MENNIKIDELVIDGANVNFALKAFKSYFDNEFSMARIFTADDLNMANALLVAILELSGKHATDIETYMDNLKQEEVSQ